MGGVFNKLSRQFARNPQHSFDCGLTPTLQQQIRDFCRLHAGKILIVPNSTVQISPQNAQNLLLHRDIPWNEYMVEVISNDWDDLRGAAARLPGLPTFQVDSRYKILRIYFSLGTDLPVYGKHQQ